MVKPVEFESERIVRWEQNKRFLIPAIAFGVVLIVTVVAALILAGSRGRTFTGGEDTPYSYSWTDNKDGSVLLEVDRSDLPDHLWTVSQESDGIVLASEEEEEEGSVSEETLSPPAFSVKLEPKQASDRASFLLTPIATGRAVLLLDLRHKDNEQDQIYEMTVLAETLEENGKLRASLISVSGAEEQGVTNGGQETAYPYTAELNESGDLLIVVTERKNEENSDPADERTTWECSSDHEEIARVLGVVYGTDDVTAYVGAGTETGRSTVRMTAKSIGVEIALECEAREDGTLLVLSHSSTAEAEAGSDTEK